MFVFLFVLLIVPGFCPGLSSPGPGNTGSGTAGHGPGAGDRADAPDDAAVRRLLRRPGGPAPQRPADDGAV